MAKYQNEVVYNIKTNLDKSGITKLNTELQQAANTIQRMGSKGLVTKDTMDKTLKNINTVKTALTKSVDSKTGMFDLKNFNTQISQAGLSINKIGQSLKSAGAEGQAAFNSLVTTTGRLDTNFKSLSTSGQKIMNTIGNTARWGVVSMAFQSIVTSVSSAVSYVEKLDDSLIQIRMVSGESAENMRKFAEYANKAASGLGSTTVDFTNATKLFIQEGFSLEESKRQATQATILANVSEQDTATTADQITAYRNAFLKDANGKALEGQAAIDQMSVSLDKFANIANHTAANVNELMVASQRAASTAAAVGADEDTFLASVATIQSVTRESAENIGNGLKSIYTRFADIKMGKDTEDGVSLGQYGQALQSAGVNILDENGQFKGMTQIFKELQEAWKTLSETEKVAVGEKVAGRFQYNRFAALMNNPEYFEKAYSASVDSEGAMERMQDTFMEGIEAKQNELKTSFESFLTEIYNGNDFAGMVEGLTDIINLVHDATDSVGGLGNTFTGLGAIMMKVFSAGIGEQISRITTNIQSQAMASRNLYQAQAQARATLALKGADTGDYRSNKFINLQSDINKNANIISPEQREKANAAGEQFAETLTKLQRAEQEEKAQLEGLKVALSAIDETYLNGVRSSDEFINRIIAAGEGAKTLGEYSKELEGKLSGTTVSASNCLKVFIELEDEYKKNGVQAETLNNQINPLKNQFKIMIEFFGESSAKGKELREMFELIEMAAKEDEEALEELRKTGLEPLREEIQDIVIGLRALQKGGDASANTLKKQKEVVKALQEQLASAEREMQLLGKSFDAQRVATSFASLTSAAMNFAFTLHSIGSLIDTWNNKDLTIGEKLKESFLDVAMISMMTLVPAVTAIGSAIGAAKEQEIAMISTTAAKIKIDGLSLQEQINLIEAEQLDVVAKQEKIAAINEEYAAAARLILLNKRLTEEEVIQLGLDQGLIAVKGEKIAATEGETAATIEESGAEIIDTGAKGANTLVTQGLTAAILGETAATNANRMAKLLLNPVLLGTVAALGALALAVYTVYKEWNKEAEAAEKATEEAKKVSQVYNDVKKELSDFKQLKIGFRDATSALSELTQGTEEWQNKLDEVNNQAEELLDKYPELAKYASYVNGQLTISEEGFNSVSNRLDTKTANARMESYAASNNKASAQNDLSMRNIQREVSLFGFTDKQTSALVSQILENPLLFQGEEDEIFKNLSNNEFFKTWDPSILRNIAHNIEKILPEVTSIKNNREQIDATNELAAMTALKTQDGFNASSENANATAKEVAARSGENSEAYRKAYSNFEKIIGTIENIDGSFETVTGLDADKVAKAYGERYNLDTIKVNGSNIKWTDDNGTEHTRSAEAVAKEMAAADALNEAAKQWRDISDQLSKILGSEANKTYGEVSGVLQNSENGIVGDFSSMSDKTVSRMYNDMKDMSSNDRRENLGLSGQQGDNWAKARGFEDANAYVEAWWSALEKYNADAIVKTQNDWKTTLGALDQKRQSSNDGTGTVVWDLSQEEQDNILKQADSIDKLDEAYERAFLSQENYLRGLKNLGSAQGVSQENLERLTRAEERYNKATKAAANAEEDNEEVQKELAEASEELAEATEEVQASLIIKDWDKARKSCEKYYETLKSSTEGTKEYNEAAQNMADVLSDTAGFDVGAEFFNSDENKKIFDDWMNNVEGSASKLQVALNMAYGSYRDKAQSYLDTFGANVQQMNSVLGNLYFDINGKADFSSILSQLGILNNGIDMGAEQALALCNYLSAIGTTRLEFEQNGKLVTLDIQSMISKLQAGDISGLVEFQNAVSAFEGQASVTGQVPAAGKPEMTNAGSSGGGSGGGGGGGGGGGKSKTIDTSKVSKTKDIYQEVNQSLERVEKRYDRINNLTDKIYGKDKLNAIKKASDAEKQHADILERKLKIQMDELDTLKNSTEDVNGNKTIGAFLGGDAFNADGSIKQDVYNAKYDELYDAIKSFEGKDEEANKDAYQEAQDALKDFTDAINAYYEALNGKDELISQLDDSLQTLSDNSVAANEALEEMTQNILEMNDAFDSIVDVYEWIENGLGEQIWTTGLNSALRHAETFFDQIITNNLTGNNVKGKVELAADTSEFWQNQLKLYEKYMRPLYENYMEVTSNDSSTAEEIAAAFDAITNMADQIGYRGGTYQEVINKVKESYSDLKSAFSDAQSQIEDLTDEIDERFGDVVDQLDRRAEQYDNIADSIESSMDMMELLYGDQSFGNRNLYRNQLVDTLSAKGQTLQEAIENQTKIVEVYKDLYGENSEEYQSAADKLNDYQGELLENTAKIQETVNNIYENTINKSVNSYINGLFGGSYDVNGLLSGDDIDWISTKWDLISDNVKQYYDDVERAYNLQKLQNKYNEMLDGETNVLNQQKITAQMQEQLKYLKEKANLSEHDVAYAEAQLEILQKTIALQEAQANKSQMKLKRDSQGNYSYAYAANEAEVSKAQEELLEAQYNAYDISKQANLETQEEIVSAISDFKSNIADVLMRKDLNPEEQLKRVQFLIQNFKQRVENSSSDLKVISEQVLREAENIAQLITSENGVGLNTILSDTSLTMNEMLGEIDERFNSSVINSLENLTSLEDGLTGLFQDAENALIQWREATEKNLEVVGTSYDTFTEDSLKPAIQSTQDLLKSTTELFETLAEKMNEAIEAAKKLVGYRDVLTAVSGNYASNGSIANLISGTNIQQFATGGYVGSWSGNIGKLAVVDSGEIILNANDTKNMIAAVSILRTMTDQMKNVALGGVLNLMSYKDKIGMTEGSSVEQRVAIEANFPNASDAEEIKRALLSISDDAYQYVGRIY